MAEDKIYETWTGRGVESGSNEGLDVVLVVHRKPPSLLVDGSRAVTAIT